MDPFEQVWISLDKFEQIQTIFDKSRQVWTCGESVGIAGVMYYYTKLLLIF